VAIRWDVHTGTHTVTLHSPSSWAKPVVSQIETPSDCRQDWVLDPTGWRINLTDRIRFDSDAPTV